jgi:hypothetical protein
MVWKSMVPCAESSRAFATHVCLGRNVPNGQVTWETARSVTNTTFAETWPEEHKFTENTATGRLQIWALKPTSQWRIVA